MANFTSVVTGLSTCLVAASVLFVSQSGQSSQTTTTQQSGSGRATATATSSGSGGGQGSASGWDIPPGMKTFSVVYSPGEAWERGKPLMQQAIQPHIEYQTSLLQSGRLLIGGPYVDVDGGQSVLIAKSMEQAVQMVEGDPAVASGLLEPEIHEWQIVLRRGPVAIRRN